MLPPALLLAALGLALAFAPRRVWGPSLLTLLVGLAAFSLLPISRAWLEPAFLGCWISLIATAACVHLVRGPSRWLALALSLNAGVWASAVVSLSGSPRDLLMALPCALVVLPASWLIGRGASIAVKVVSSWVIAVAILAAALQLLPVTPGYLPDHLE